MTRTTKNAKPATTTLTTSQPEVWVVAFKAQASRDGMTLSAWLADCALANLDDDLRRGLPERPANGRPRKATTTN